MRLSRIIMALTVGLAVVAVPAVAGAAPQPSPTVSSPPVYTPELASLTVNRPAIYLGGTVTLTGRNFESMETVTIVVRVQSSVVDTFTVETNADGGFTREYTPEVTGHHTFTATGESGRNDSAELRVLPKKKPHLPVTGSSLGTPMKVGGGLVAAGAVMLLGTMLWRRRNRFGAGAAG
ncbi:hypothetical protein [Micromonospora sp. DT229]|uniref:hypothetical protein n=1 Tax=Micromonospora sp. DT229 TaxID=3393430 RepID=UPI003CFA3538